MTNQEFSIEFDILYNNISSNKAPGLNEYEKSVFLTKAQEDIITELYTGRNGTQNSFEETEELRRYLSRLVKTGECPSMEGPPNSIINNFYYFILPEDLLYIIYEVCRDNSMKEFSVYPVSHDELSKIINNPFRGPSKNRVLRLDNGTSLINEEDHSAEIISTNKIVRYTIRYIRKPNPIILENLTDGLTINGESGESECELDSSIHRTILDRAVALALQTMYSK